MYVCMCKYSNKCYWLLTKIYLTQINPGFFLYAKNFSFRNNVIVNAYHSIIWPRTVFPRYPLGQTEWKKTLAQLYWIIQDVWKCGGMQMASKKLNKHVKFDFKDHLYSVWTLDIVDYSPPSLHLPTKRLKKDEVFFAVHLIVTIIST